MRGQFRKMCQQGKSSRSMSSGHNLEGKCWHCGKLGNSKKDCWHLKNEKKDEKHNQTLTEANIVDK